MLLLVKLLFKPVPRSAMATRSVSRTPFPLASVSPVVSAKCLRLEVRGGDAIVALPRACITTGRKRAPAHLTRHLLFAVIAYRLQADRFGDLGAFVEGRSLHEHQAAH